jgi:hypothetical protein
MNPKRKAEKKNGPKIEAPTNDVASSYSEKWTQFLGSGQKVCIGEMEMQVVMQNAGPSPVRVLTNFVDKTLVPGQLYVQRVITELSLQTAEDEYSTVEMQFIPYFRRRS